MASQEERLLILKMIDEGKISADEGARLLAAIRPSAEAPNENAKGTQSTAQASHNTASHTAFANAGDTSTGATSSGAKNSRGVHIGVDNIDPTAEETSAQNARSGGLDHHTATASSIRLRVSDPSTDAEKVDVNVPLKLVEFGLRFLPDTDDSRIENFRAAVYKGKAGSIIDTSDGDNAKQDTPRVVVSLE